MDNPAFSIKNLELRYKDNTVISKLTCDIAAHKISYIIGSNGAGKSTLVKTLIGTLKPHTGTIRIFGKPLDSKAIAEHVGYVPQYSSIDRSFPITVNEMIALECNQKTHCNIGILGHLKIFNAEKLINKKISELSGGELQKALIARALVTNPEILILDEPFNNLDHKTEFDLIALLKNLEAEHGKTIIFVTHDLSIINLENANALYLNHGTGVYGQAKEVVKEHQLMKI